MTTRQMSWLLIAGNLLFVGIEVWLLYTKPDALTMVALAFNGIGLIVGLLGARMLSK